MRLSFIFIKAYFSIYCQKQVYIITMCIGFMELMGWSVRRWRRSDGCCCWRTMRRRAEDDECGGEEGAKDGVTVDSAEEEDGGGNCRGRRLEQLQIEFLKVF